MTRDKLFQSPIIANKLPHTLLDQYSFRIQKGIIWKIFPLPEECSISCSHSVVCNWWLVWWWGTGVKGWLLAKRSRRIGSVDQWSPFPCLVVTLFTQSPGWDSGMIDWGSKSESCKKQQQLSMSLEITILPLLLYFISQSYHRVCPNSKEGEKNLISLWEEGLRIYSHL